MQFAALKRSFFHPSNTAPCPCKRCQNCIAIRLGFECLASRSWSLDAWPVCNYVPQTSIQALKETYLSHSVGASLTEPHFSYLGMVIYLHLPLCSRHHSRPELALRLIKSVLYFSGWCSNSQATELLIYPSLSAMGMYPSRSRALLIS